MPQVLEFTSELVVPVLVFVYVGDCFSGEVVPRRSVGLFGGDCTQYSEDGWRLFEHAVLWSVNRIAGEALA